LVFAEKSGNGIMSLLEKFVLLAYNKVKKRMLHLLFGFINYLGKMELILQCFKKQIHSKITTLACLSTMC